MKIKHLILTVIATISSLISLSATAHEGHAPAGIVHELHHILWIVMALAVSAVAVFLVRKGPQKKEDSQD